MVCLRYTSLRISIISKYPKDLMGRDFMIASRVSSTSNNKDIAAGQMPRNPVLVTFSADKKKIYMHKKMVRNLCDTTSNMYAAFQRNFSILFGKHIR